MELKTSCKWRNHRSHVMSARWKRFNFNLSTIFFQSLCEFVKVRATETGLQSGVIGSPDGAEIRGIQEKVKKAFSWQKFIDKYAGTEIDINCSSRLNTYKVYTVWCIKWNKKPDYEKKYKIAFLNGVDSVHFVLAQSHQNLHMLTENCNEIV